MKTRARNCAVGARFGIEPLESRIAPASIVTLVDSDGDTYTVKLGGPGTATVLQVSPGDDSAIASIVLTDTTAKSALSVTVKRAAGGDGEVSIGAITGGSLGSITAAKSDLVGAGLALTGTAKSVRFDDVLNGADLSIGAGGTRDAVKIQLGAVGNGTSIVSGIRISSLTAESIGDGSITAPVLGPLKTTAGRMISDLLVAGNASSVSIKGEAGGEWTAKRFGAVSVVGGDLDATIVATETAAVLKKTPALASLTVTGGNFTGEVLALGAVGAVKALKSKAGTGGGVDAATVTAAKLGAISVAADLTDSLILAGADLGSDRRPGGIGAAADTFIGGTIASFTVKGSVNSSVVGAGLISEDAAFNQQDAIVGGTTSRMNGFRIFGDASNDSLFAAGVFKRPVRIGAATIDALSDARFLTIGGADVTGPLVLAHLSNDTGASNADGITRDGAIAGSVGDLSGIVQLRAGFDATPAAGFANVLADLLPGGTFAFDMTRLDAINGAALADGVRTLHIEATDGKGQVRTRDFTFTLDRTVSGGSLGLSLTSDTGAVGDGTTSAARVTLTGDTEPGAAVTLNPLSSATTANPTGAFAFGNVALVSGANAFTLRVVDRAGNQADFNGTITFDGGAAGADPVLAWNTHTLDAIRADSANPLFASRTLAMVSAAMFDVVNALDGVAGLYVNVPAAAGASLTAAIAQAAHDVLANEYPNRTATFDARLAASLSGLSGQSLADGVVLGAAVADAIIALRANDGSRDFFEYAPGSAPGEWQPTGPGFDPALAPWWPDVDSWALTNRDQFRPDGPDALTSAEWAADFNQVKDLGRFDSTTRTADQTQIARFWADGMGTYTPPGHWNTIAQTVAVAEGNSVATNARLFAMLNVALADAAIVAWDAKYTFDFWRPETAIRNAADDGNAATSVDATWSSLIPTPAFPEYVSGHSTFSGAAAEVLGSFFGDDTAFTSSSTSLPGVTRNFTSFTQAADEAGMSRIYGGIHFLDSDLDGLAAGRALGALVVEIFSGVDTQPPKVLVDDFDTTVSSSPTLTGRVTDLVSGVVSFTAQIDAGAPAAVTFDANGNFTLPLNLTTHDVHTITLLATDALGHATMAVLGVTLDTLAPTLSITAPVDEGNITAGLRLTGSANGTGTAIAELCYAFDAGTLMPITFNLATGVFDVPLEFGALAPGPHTLTITTKDSAGNSAVQTLDLTLGTALPLTIDALQPNLGQSEVGVTFRPKIDFSRPVDPLTLTSTSFFASYGGATLPATIVPTSDGTAAWLFFDDPLPGGATIQLTIDGSLIETPDGTALDADNDGTPGGTLRTSFRTVSTTGIAGTTLTGILNDPGPDLIPHTFDDQRAGPDQTLFTDDDVFLLPIAGVKIYIHGMESSAVFTGADGRFTIPNIPVGNVKIVVDGTTATNAPAGFYFPEMVMEIDVEAGGEFWTMEDMDEFSLPRIRTAALEMVNAGSATTITLDPESGGRLTPEQQAQVQFTVPANSLIGKDGQPMANAQIGISEVASDFVRDMLPTGVSELPFSFTVQALGVERFTTPVPITLPNVYHAAPGTKMFLVSYDHATGLMEVEGNMTVSADGLSLTSDPGTGITHPGWHFPAPPPPPDPDPPDDDCEGSDNRTPNDGALPFGAQAAAAEPKWGNDFVTIAFLNLSDSQTIRLRSDDGGYFRSFVPGGQDYRLVIFDPESGLIGEKTGTTPGLGIRFRITDGITFAPSNGPDSDGDGLNDDAEFAIGTRSDRIDSDGDGLGDRVEIEQGLDPLSNRVTALGVIAALSVSGQAKEISVIGGTDSATDLIGFVATGTYGLAIADLSEFRRPIVLSELDLPGDATDVAVDAIAKIAVVAANAGGLHFIDVEDPLNPVLLRTLNVGASQVEIAAGLAYASVGAQVRSFDLFTGEALGTVSQPGGNTITGMAREGETLFTTDTARVLRSIDIANFALTLLDSETLPHGAGKVTVANGVAYAVAPENDRGGFSTVDVSDPANLTLISGSDVSSPFVLPKGALAVNGSGLAVLVGPQSGPLPAVTVMDVSDPADTDNSLVRYDVNVAPQGVTIAGGIAFVASGTAGVQVVNYRAFDTGAQAPANLVLTSTVADADAGTAGVQVIEGTAIPLRVGVSDDVQVRGVELLVNGEVVENDVSAPFEFFAVAPAIAPGASSVTLQVRATDTGGNTTLSAPLTFGLVEDSAGPVIVAHSPNIAGFDVRTLSLRFNESVDPASIVPGGFTLLDLGTDEMVGGGDDTPATLGDIFAVGTRSVALSTDGPLAAGNYQLTVAAGAIADIAGNALAAPLSFTFTNYNADPNAKVWISPTSGNWNDPANWLGGTVPTASDVVLIDVPGASPTITVNGNFTVKNITSKEALVVASSQQLTLTGGESFLDGSVTLSGGTLRVSGAGAMLEINGVANIASGAVRAENGSFIELHTLGSLAVNFSTTIEANGAGSRILLSDAASLPGATGFSGVNVNAFNSGRVELPALASVPNGVVRFYASGGTAMIDLPSLSTVIDDQAGAVSQLYAQNGGDVNAPLLTTIENVELIADGASSTLDVAQLTDIDTLSIFVRNGAVVSFPGVTAINGNSFTTTIEANSGSATINFPNLVTIHGGTGFARVHLDAFNSGATINLPALTTVPDGAARFYASGTGTLISVPLLTSFTDTSPNATSQIIAENGGNVDTPLLTTIENTELIANGVASTLDTAQITDIDTLSIFVRNGAVVSFPGVTAINGNSFTTTIEANSGSATINFPNLVTIHGGTGFARVHLDAFNSGATINLPALTTVPDGAARFYASGTGTLLSAPLLASFVDTSGGATSQIIAENSGDVDAPLLTTIENVELIASGAGSTLDTAQLTDIDTLNVVVRNGAVVSFPGVTAINGNSFTTTIEADSGSATINFPNLVTIHGGTGFARVQLHAFNSGATINLPALTSIPDGTAQLYASGTGTLISAPLLASFVDSSGGATGQIIAESGGNVDTPLLTTIENAELIVDGPGSTFDTAQLTDIDTLSIFSRDGATISFPNVATLTGNSFTTTIEASNGGVISFPSLATIHGGSGFARVQLHAFNTGATIQLPALTSVPDGAARLYAAGTGTLIDAPVLASFVDNAPSATSQIFVEGTGEVNIPLLTTIENTELVADGPGSTMDTAQLTDIDTLSIYSRDGATFTFAGVTSITGNAFSTVLESSGGNALLSFPNLTTIHGATGSTALSVNAFANGSVSFPALASIPDGTVRFDANGTSATISLPALTNFTDNNPGNTSVLFARNGGSVQLTASTLTVSAVTVEVNGAFSVGTLELGAGALLYGNNTLTGNLLNTSGTVGTGSFGGGMPMVTGNFTQMAAGTLVVWIHGLTPFSGYERLVVGGTASLAGTLSLSTNAIDPALGSTFTILTAASRTGTFGTVTGPLSGGKSYSPSYDVTSVTLTVV